MHFPPVLRDFSAGFASPVGTALEGVQLDDYSGFMSNERQSPQSKPLYPAAMISTGLLSAGESFPIRDSAFSLALQTARTVICGISRETAVSGACACRERVGADNKIGETSHLRKTARLSAQISGTRRWNNLTTGTCQLCLFHRKTP